jgi:dTDP-4-amino-4,6-dideoxygalactose transaminase
MTAVAPTPITAAPIPFCSVLISPEARAAADRILGSGWVTTGPEVEAFEAEFAARVGAEHAVAVASCTAGLELALRALDLRPGSLVLTSALTFSGAVHAIVHAGLRPVLVDVDPETLMPGPGEVAAAQERCGGAQAMVVLHYGGAPAPVSELAAAARLPLERVVEDAAHALWTQVGGMDVGSASSMACFSFYATKNLPIGEGGMVTTKDSRTAAYLRSARLHGMSDDAWRRYLPGGRWRYDVGIDGIKANMTDVAAAIGRAQLRHLPGWQQRREELAQRYREQLADLDGVRLPRQSVAGRHAWHLFVVRVESGPASRDEVADALGQEGIGTSVHFIPVHHLSYFKNLLGDTQSPLPGTDLAGDSVLSLPMHPGLADTDVDRVCAALARALAHADGRGGR